MNTGPGDISQLFQAVGTPRSPSEVKLLAAEQASQPGAIAQTIPDLAKLGKVIARVIEVNLHTRLMQLSAARPTGGSGSAAGISPNQQTAATGTAPASTNTGPTAPAFVLTLRLPGVPEPVQILSRVPVASGSEITLEQQNGTLRLLPPQPQQVQQGKVELALRASLPHQIPPDRALQSVLQLFGKRIPDAIAERNAVARVLGHAIKSDRITPEIIRQAIQHHRGNGAGDLRQDLIRVLGLGQKMQTEAARPAPVADSRATAPNASNRGAIDSGNTPKGSTFAPRVPAPGAGPAPSAAAGARAQAGSRALPTPSMTQLQQAIKVETNVSTSSASAVQSGTPINLHSHTTTTSGLTAERSVFDALLPKAARLATQASVLNKTISLAVAVQRGPVSASAQTLTTTVRASGLLPAESPRLASQIPTPAALDSGINKPAAKSTVANVQFVNSNGSSVRIENPAAVRTPQPAPIGFSNPLVLRIQPAPITAPTIQPTAQAPGNTAGISSTAETGQTPASKAQNSPTTASRSAVQTPAIGSDPSAKGSALNLTPPGSTDLTNKIREGKADSAISTKQVRTDGPAATRSNTVAPQSNPANERTPKSPANAIAPAVRHEASQVKTTSSTVIPDPARVSPSRGNSETPHAGQTQQAKNTAVRSSGPATTATTKPADGSAIEVQRGEPTRESGTREALDPRLMARNTFVNVATLPRLLPVGYSAALQQVMGASLAVATGAADSEGMTPTLQDKLSVSNHAYAKLLTAIAASAISRSSSRNRGEQDGVSQMMRQVLGALSRIQVNQLLSLAPQSAEQGPQANNQIHSDIAVFHQNHFDNVHVRIEEEEQGSKQEQEAQETGKRWTIHLDFDLYEYGMMYAQANLVASSVNAKLWLTKASTFHRAQEEIKHLVDALTAGGVEVEAVECFQGEPPRRETRLDYQLIDVHS